MPGLKVVVICAGEFTVADAVVPPGGLPHRYITTLPAAKLLPLMVNDLVVESAGTDVIDKELIAGGGTATVGCGVWKYNGGA